MLYFALNIAGVFQAFVNSEGRHNAYNEDGYRRSLLSRLQQAEVRWMSEFEGMLRSLILTYIVLLQYLVCLIIFSYSLGKMIFNAFTVNFIVLRYFMSPLVKLVSFTLPQRSCSFHFPHHWML